MDSDVIQRFLNINTLEKLNIERNPTSENLSCLVDNKKLMYPHGKLHTLTDRKEKYISTTMYQYLENIILQDSQRNTSCQDNEVSVTQ